MGYSNLINSKNYNGSVEISYDIETHGWYDEENILLLEESLKGTNIILDHVDFDNATIILRDGNTTIYLDHDVFNHFIRNNGEYSLEEVWNAWKKVPKLFKENISSFQLDENCGLGGWHWGDTDHDNPHKSIVAMGEHNFSGAFETKGTSWDMRQIMLHECAHALDYHKGKWGVDEMELTTYSDKFKRISETEIASSYVKKDVMRNKPEHFLRENFADAMMIVASHRIYGSGKIGDDKLPYVTNGSNDISYNQWKDTHPQLDKLCNDILNCENWEEVESLF